MTAPMPFDFDLDALFEANPSRLAHMRDAASFARDLATSAELPKEQADLLVHSALLHDIGYAPSLRRFSFHPLDGALFLEERGVHPWIVEGVLRHSMADRRAADFPDVAVEYASRPPETEAEWLVRAVTMADWRAAGIGGRVSLGQRLQDIVERNPGNADKAARARAMVVEVRTWFLDWAAQTFAAHPLPWVFCDVDNTLIRPGDTLSAVNASAIKAYVQASGRFSLATGKHPSGVARLAAQLGLNTAQMAANGTCMVENGKVTVLSHLGSAATGLVARLEAMRLPMALYREHSIEAGGFWEDWLDDVFVHYGEIRPVRRLEPGPVLKILCIAGPEDARREQELRDLADEMGVDVCRSDKHFLEFLPRAGNKGHAVRMAAERAHWPVLHTVAVGDTENDAAMFAQCGASAAVTNATEEARLGADWIIPACTENGVGWMLDRLLQGRGWSAFGRAESLK